MATLIERILWAKRWTFPLGFTGNSRTSLIRKLLLQQDGLPYQGSKLPESPLFSLSKSGFRRVLVAAFVPELDMMRDTDRATPERPQGASCHAQSAICPSWQLYGLHIDEVDRLLSSFDALHSFINNDYEDLVIEQSYHRLSQDSFSAYRSHLLNSLPGPTDIWVLIVLIIIGDLGKSGRLQSMVSVRTIDESDHDVVLFEAARLNLIELLRDLTGEDKSIVMQVLLLSTSFSMSQIVQGENTAGNLQRVRSILKDDARALRFTALKTDFDVMGAAGHVSATGSRTWNEDLHRLHEVARHSMFGVLNGGSFQAAYNEVLQARLNIIIKGGWAMEHDMDEPEGYALLRLFAMGRVSTLQQATVLQQALKSLKDFEAVHVVDFSGHQIRGYYTELVEGLWRDKDDEFVLYYGPATLVNVLAFSDPAALVGAIAAVFRLFGKALAGGKLGTYRGVDLRFAATFVKSKEFMENPELLDDQQPPKGVYLRKELPVTGHRKWCMPWA